MADCDICRILENKSSFKVIYEDEKCLSVLHEMPSTPGHALLFPKKHSPIFEEVDDQTVGHIFDVANKISTSIFDSLNVLGTNILVNNGIAAGQELPHFLINIIPRKENDGINFEWTPNKKPDDELLVTQSMILAFSQPIFSEQGASASLSKPAPVTIEHQPAPQHKPADKQPAVVMTQMQREPVIGQKVVEEKMEEKKAYVEKEDYMIKRLRRIP